MINEEKCEFRWDIIELSGPTGVSEVRRFLSKVNQLSADLSQRIRALAIIDSYQRGFEASGESHWVRSSINGK